MWQPLVAGTPLFRVTRSGDQWSDVLQGYGAFYATGGRYHAARQQTVYASENPLVALTEYAWHVRLGWCGGLATRQLVTYPPGETAKLWKFSFVTPISLVDLTSPACVAQLGYPPHVPNNPHVNRYKACRRVANKVLLLTQPPAPNARPEGFHAPSVRTPHTKRHSPRQIVLFVMPAAVIGQTLEQRATLIDQWDVEYEYLEPLNSQPATVADALIGWSTPRMRLTGGGSLPRPPGRTGTWQSATGQWNSLQIRYSPY